jgi:hypothetical protein
MNWWRARATYCRCENLNLHRFVVRRIQGLQDITKFKMRTRITSRLLAVALILSVGLFAMQAAGHWHGHESDEQHCQVCHVGHVAVPQAVAQMKLLAPVLVARFAAADEKMLPCETLRTHRIPRAPPVQL